MSDENYSNNSGGLIGLIVVIAIGFFAYNSFLKKDDITLYYYPDAPNLYEFTEKEVSSLDECRDLAETWSVRDARPYYDYECGINCRDDSSFTSAICEKTVE